MKAERFEDIIVWQKSKSFTVDVYKCFKESKDFSFRDQIQRASISIMNNIAEGFERRTNNDFKHFLYIAKGSCGEVRSMLHLAKETNKINEQTFNELYNSSLEISKMLSGFIKAL
jgi:four helix bundle protein